MHTPALRKIVFEHESIAKKVALEIKALILSGQLEAGGPISEVELAQALQVSRTPVREAVRELAKQGLITVQPRRRAIVSNIGEKDAADIARIRTVLERLTFSLLCEAPDGAIDYARLRLLSTECFDKHRDGDVAGAIESDSQFHLELARQTDNIHHYELLASFMPKIQLLRLRQRMPAPSMKPYFNQHDEMLDLLEQRKEAELAELLELHIFHNIDRRRQ